MRVTGRTSPSLTGGFDVEVDQKPCPSCDRRGDRGARRGRSIDDRLDDAGHRRVGLVGHHDPTVPGRIGPAGRAQAAGATCGSTRPDSPAGHAHLVPTGQRRTHGRQRLVCRRTHGATAASRSTTSARTPPPSCVTATRSPTRRPSKRPSRGQARGCDRHEAAIADGAAGGHRERRRPPGVARSSRPTATASQPRMSTRGPARRCARTSWRRSSTTRARGRLSPAAVASSTPTPWSRCSVKVSPTGTTRATPDP